MVLCKKKSFFTIIVLAILFCMQPVRVLADGNTYKAVIPVKIVDENHMVSDNTKIHLVVERKKPHAPLPVPHELVVGKSGTFYFNPIEFSEPGNYVYVVKEYAEDDENLICDTSEYEVCFTVIREADGHLEGGYTLSLEDHVEKPLEIVFRNYYKTVGGGESPSSAISSDSTPDNTLSDTSGDTPGNNESVTSDASDTPDGTSSDMPSTPGTGEALSPAFATLLLSGLVCLFYCVKRRHRCSNDVD